MKIYVILISCLCGTLAITVHYEGTELLKNAKDYKETLKDIRLVPVNQVQSRQKSSHLVNKQLEVFTIPEKLTGEPKINHQHSQIKSRGDKKKFKASKVNPVARQYQTNFQSSDENHQTYMQKMADQLYIAQKHASVLSDYQKFIINQDPQVKSFVLGQATQVRTPKPFSRPKQSGRAISAQPTKVQQVASEPTPTASDELKRIVVVTSKAQSASKKVSLLPNDYSAQPTDLKYVTLAPTHSVEPHEPTNKVTLVPYHTSQPYTYYDLGITQKPQVETVQIPSTLSLGLGSYESPQYHHEESGHIEEHHHVDPKYEFMYNVKDHEKNNHFGHMESRTDKGTYGYYFVHLPDGRLETVKYWADKTGYHAKVDYQGEAKHPSSTEYKIHSHHNLAHY